MMSYRDILLEEAADIESIKRNDPTFNFYHACIDSDKEAAILAIALRGNTHLKELILDCGPDVRNKKCAKALAKSIVRAQVTNLHLQWHDVFCEEDFHVTRRFLKLPRQSSTIQHLTIEIIDEESIGEIANCLPHLQSLKLTGDYWDFEVLCEGLERTSTLTSLQVDCITVGMTDEIRLLSQTLANHSSITSVHLEMCGMNDDCVKAFVEHWHNDSPISTLAFIHTEIKAEGAMLLIQAASSHPAMESLSIRGSERFKHEGLANIAMELPNIVLKSLNLTWCVSPRSGRINENQREAAVVVGDLIVQGVKANTHLVEIDVSHNGFDDATEQNIKEALAFYTLRNKYSPLMVSELQLPASIWCDCFAKNGQNASFIFHFLREQPMLWQICCKNKKQRTS